MNDIRKLLKYSTIETKKICLMFRDELFLTFAMNVGQIFLFIMVLLFRNSLISFMPTLKTAPPFVNAQMFCSSRDIWVS